MSGEYLTITMSEARRFLLAYHGLWQPHSLYGSEGILSFIRDKGCVQVDPIDVVGRNQDLVLQARVGDYRADMLDGLCYGTRKLLEGFDKQASIFMSEDWPYFYPLRKSFQEQYLQPDNPLYRMYGMILNRIENEGPLCSADFKDSSRIRNGWGPVRSIRMALEHLYRMGKLGIHHRVNRRRYFDLIERLLPPKLFSAPNPHGDMDTYHDWHVLRRVRGMGLILPYSGSHWSGIFGAGSKERLRSLERLVKHRRIVPVKIEGLEKSTFYMPRGGLRILNFIKHNDPSEFHASFIAPLDNLLWDRKMIAMLFGFEYVWELYVPKERRRYGYYTLPVLYGESFVARVDFRFDKRTRILSIDRWWWQSDVVPSGEMLRAINVALERFARYLDARNNGGENGLQNPDG